MAAQSFKERISARIGHRDPSDRVPWHLHDKRKCYALAADLSIQTAKVYQCARQISEIDFERLPFQFVLKPTTGHSTKGMMALLKDVTEDRYFNILNQQFYSLEQVVALQEEFRLSNPFKESYRLLAEEFLVPEDGRAQIPYDYKCYAFNGCIALIVQINRNTRPYECNWFDAYWINLPIDSVIDWTGKHRSLTWAMGAGLADRDKWGPRTTEGEPVIPECREDLIRTAALVSRKIESPFCRVDLYATTRGCVLGEITLTPGGPWAGSQFFTDQWDLRLGELWESQQVSAQAST